METFDQDPGTNDQIAAPVTEPTATRSRWLVPGLIIVAVLAIGAVALATMNAADSGDGAESPEAAMQLLFDGLAAEDLIAGAGAFLPSEANPAIEYTTAITDELKRLNVLSGAADPESIVGLDLDFTDMTYDVVEIAPGFARVYVTGGNATASADPASLPLGDLLYDNLSDPELDELLNSGPQSDTSSMAGEDFFMVAVDDGGWYLSLWYTIAEAARLDAGGPVPDFGNGLDPVGAGSAKEAVEAAFRELLDLDLEGLVGMLPPEEMRALYDYLPLILDDYNQQVGTLGAFVDIQLDALETTTTGAGDGKVRVAVTSFAISFDSLFLEIDGSINFDGKCLDVAVNDRGGNLSGFGELPPRINTCDLQNELGSAADLPEFLSDIGSAQVGLIAVQGEDKRWYVSPSHTIGDAIVQSLDVWDAATIQEYLDFLMDFDMGASPALF